MDNTLRLACTNCIRGLLKTPAEQISLVPESLHKVNLLNDSHVQVLCNWAAHFSKQVSDRLEYCTHVHQNMVNTSPTCPKCAYKIPANFSGV